MLGRVQIISVLMVVFFLWTIFQLIRKNKLMEQYSLLWILSAFVLLVLAVWRNLLHQISAWVGIAYPPSTYFLIAILCGLIVAVHFSVVISRLTQQTHELAQELALLKEEIGRAKQNSNRKLKDKPA